MHLMKISSFWSVNDQEVNKNLISSSNLDIDINMLHSITNLKLKFSFIAKIIKTIQIKHVDDLNNNKINVEFYTP